MKQIMYLYACFVHKFVYVCNVYVYNVLKLFCIIEHQKYVYNLELIFSIHCIVSLCIV